MTVTATKKFAYTIDGGARLFFPGMEIDHAEAAAWAVAQGYGEERGEQQEAKVRTSPASPEARAVAGAPENKAKAAPAKKGQFFKRAKADDGGPVLGSEDEVEQGDDAEQK